MEKTFESIRPLIVSQEEDGMMIKLKFKAANQETPLETVAVITPDQNEIMKNAMKQAGKAAAVNMGANMAGNALGNMIGGTAGQIAKAASSTAARAASSSAMNMDKIMQTDASEEKKQAAILQAFEHFSMYYVWENDQWIYKVPGQ